MLKIAGVKSEKEFYKKFPDEASFMAKHGKEFKKAMRGSKIDKAQVGDEILQLSGEVRPTIEYTPSNVPMYNPYAQPRPTVKTAPLPKTQLGNVKDMGAKPAISSTPTATKAPTDIAPYLQAGVDVVEGLSMIRDQRDAVRSAKQQSELGKIYEMGVASVPAQQPRRQYVTPYDVEMQPEQMFPSYGVGTNVLAQDGAMIGGNPTEIQNTFAPNTIYTDLGYQPLNDPSKMKQYEMGGELPIAAKIFLPLTLSGITFLLGIYVYTFVSLSTQCPYTEMLALDLHSTLIGSFRLAAGLRSRSSPDTPMLTERTSSGSSPNFAIIRSLTDCCSTRPFAFAEDGFNVDFLSCFDPRLRYVHPCVTGVHADCVCNADRIVCF